MIRNGYSLHYPACAIPQAMAGVGMACYPGLAGCAYQELGPGLAYPTDNLRTYPLCTYLFSPSSFMAYNGYATNFSCSL